LLRKMPVQKSLKAAAGTQQTARQHGSKDVVYNSRAHCRTSISWPFGIILPAAMHSGLDRDALGIIEQIMGTTLSLLL
jgi:hypothetical protein